MSFKLLQRFKRKKPETNFEDVKCANCETQFTGKFCPNCGQAVKDYDKPFSFVFYNFLGDFFAFDTRFFRTIISLLFKPGFLSKEYIEGRRVRYAPPFRIFVFVSFVLFLMLQNYTNRGLTTVLDSDIQKNNAKLDSILAVSGDSIASVLVSEMSEEELKVTDSILSDYGLSDTTGAENLDFKLNLATFKDTRDLRACQIRKCS